MPREHDERPKQRWTVPDLVRRLNIEIAIRTQGGARMTNAKAATTPSPALLKVLDGTVDLHCHSGPSPFPRRLDHVEASYDGARINMRAILCKSHHHNTVMDLLAMK